MNKDVHKETVNVETDARKNKGRSKQATQYTYSIEKLTHAEVNKEVCPPMMCKSLSSSDSGIDWLRCIEDS